MFLLNTSHRDKMNKEIGNELEYAKFGNLMIISEKKYYKGTLCKCWCECGNIFNINKEKLIDGSVLRCFSPKHDEKKKKKAENTKKEKKLYINYRTRSRFKILKRAIKSSKYKSDLTLENYFELSKITACHYCGASIPWSNKSSAYFLDRKDNKIGYMKDNCAVCCTRCNFAKGNRFTYSEWKKIGDFIKSWE